MADGLTTTELFLAALIVVFALPWLVWRFARTDSYAPLVVVQIVTGILLGPGIAGELAPELHAQLFAPEVIMVLNGIAWWAVSLFVWTAGLELDLSGAWRRKRETAVTAGLALGTPLLLGLLTGATLLAWGGAGWIGARGTPLQFIAGIGMSCAVTALPILVLLMERLEILRSRLGQRVLGYASLDDIAIWGVLALILVDWERIARQGAFLLAFALLAWGLRRLILRLSVPDRWALAMVWLPTCGLGADWSGLHFMVGAFLAGMVLEARWFDEARLDHFREGVLLALMPAIATARRARWAVFSHFFVFGILWGSWAAQIPFALDRLAVSTSVFGFSLLSMAAGAVLAMPLAAAMVVIEVRVVLAVVGLGHEHLHIAIHHLFLLVSENPFSGGVEGLNGAAGVDGDEPVNHRVHHALELHGEILPLRFEGLALGDVADDADEHLLARHAHFADRQVHRKDGPVLSPRGDLATDPDNLSLAAVAVVREVVVVLTVVGLGHEHLHVLARHFGRGVSKNPFSRRIEGLYVAAVVDGHQPVDHGVHHPRELLGEPLRLLPLRDVAHDADVKLLLADLHRADS